MAESDLDRTRVGTPLWVRIVLGVSLALNVLVAGVVLGAALGGGPGDRVRGDPGAMPFVRALAPEERRALLREMRREGGERLPAARRETRERVGALLAALRAETMDRGAVEALLNAQTAEGAARQALGQKVLLDHLERLGPEARRAYADRLEDALKARVR